MEKVSVQRKALIIKFGQIGDVIMAIPAAYALYKKNYEIHWMCGSVVQPLLESYSWIHVIPANDKAILFGGPITRLINIVAQWKKIGLGKYDLCATLYYDKRYRLLALPVRANRKLSLSRKSRKTSIVAGRHHSDEYFRVLLGGKDGYRDETSMPVRPDRLPPSPVPKKNASKRIAIVPGGAANLLRQQVAGSSSNQTLRRWPIEHYVQLVHHLFRRGWEVVLLGGKDDAWVKEYFQELPVIDCISKLSLPEVISVCDTCDAVISNDTGPLHLAGLSEARLVGIFGPTDPGNFLPRRPFVTGIWGGYGLACRPCYDGRDFAPCQFNGCLHQVTVALVLRELDSLLTDWSQQRSSPWRIVVPDENLRTGNQDFAILPSI